MHYAIPVLCLLAVFVSGSCFFPAFAQMNPLSQTERANVDLVVNNLHKMIDSLESLKQAAKNRQSVQEYDEAKQLYQGIVQNIERKLQNNQIISVPGLDDNKNKKYQHDGQESSPKAAYCGDGKTKVKNADGTWVDCPQGTILVDKKILDPANGTPIDESTQDGWQKKWSLAHVIVHEKAHEVMIREQIAELQKQRWWNELSDSEKNKRVAIATEHGTTAEKHAQVYLVQKNLLKAEKETLNVEKKQVSDQKKAIKNNAANRPQIQQLESQISAIDAKIKWLDDTWRDLEGSMRRAVQGSEFGHEHCGWPLDFHSGVAAIMVTFPAGFEQFDLTVKDNDVTDLHITQTQWYGDKITVDKPTKKPTLYMKMSDTVFSGQFIQPEVCEYLDWATQNGLLLVSKSPITDKKDSDKTKTAVGTSGNTAVSADGNNVKILSVGEIKSLYRISKLQESVSMQLLSVNDQQKSILQKATSAMNKDLSKEKKDQLKSLLKEQDSDKKDIKTIQDYAKMVSAAIKTLAQKQGIKSAELDKIAKISKGSKQAGPVNQLKQDAAEVKNKLEEAKELSDSELTRLAIQLGDILPDSEGKTSFDKFIDKLGEREQARQTTEQKQNAQDINPIGLTQQALEQVQKKEETQTGSILNTIPDTPTKDRFVQTTPTKDTSIQVQSKHSSYAQSNNPCVNKSAKILATWVLKGIPSGKASVMITNLDVDPDTVPLNFLNADVRDGTIQYEFTVPGPGHYEVSIWSIDNRPVSGGSMNITVPDSCNTATPQPALVEPSGGTTQPPTKTNTKPSLTIPKSITREATGPSGAVVNFVATGQDKEDGALTPSCSYPSDYMFPIGTTTVSCTVDDSNNNSISGTFTVTIRDTTPPVFSPFQATQGVKDESGIQMFFDVIAVDAVDGGVQVNCDYPSGHKFPPGITTMTCTALDSKGNLATKKVQITVTVTQSGQ